MIPTARRPRRLLATLLLCALPVAAPAPAPAAEPGAEDPAARAIMGEALDALRVLLPLSLDEKRFEAPENRARIEAALDVLTERAERLAAHGRTREESFEYLSRALERDVRAIRRQYAAGERRAARFMLHELVTVCVTCHSRLPSSRDSSIAERLMRDEQIAALPLDERAKLQMATRRWEDALASYEELFATTDQEGDFLDFMGYLDDYVDVSVRVRDDPVRARRGLERFAARPDLSPDLRRNVELWIATLEELEADGDEGDGLAQARRWIAAADAERFPTTRSALVAYVAASSALNRFVASRPNQGPEVAEAYYLLGLVEYRVGRVFWLHQAEFFLVTAIRLDPGGPAATRAWELLDELVEAGYGRDDRGSDRDMRILLDELRRIIVDAGGSLPERRGRARPGAG